MLGPAVRRAAVVIGAGTALHLASFYGPILKLAIDERLWGGVHVPDPGEEVLTKLNVKKIVCCVIEACS
jgi:hypothetical protein